MKFSLQQGVPWITSKDQVQQKRKETQVGLNIQREGEREKSQPVLNTKWIQLTPGVLHHLHLSYSGRAVLNLAQTRVTYCLWLWLSMYGYSKGCVCTYRVRGFNKRLVLLQEDMVKSSNWDFLKGTGNQSIFQQSDNLEVGFFLLSFIKVHGTDSIALLGPKLKVSTHLLSILVKQLIPFRITN